MYMYCKAASVSESLIATQYGSVRMNTKAYFKWLLQNQIQDFTNSFLVFKDNVRDVVRQTRVVDEQMFVLGLWGWRVGLRVPRVSLGRCDEIAPVIFLCQRE